MMLRIVLFPHGRELRGLAAPDQEQQAGHDDGKRIFKVGAGRCVQFVKLLPAG